MDTCISNVHYKCYLDVFRFAFLFCRSISGYDGATLGGVGRFGSRQYEKGTRLRRLFFSLSYLLYECLYHTQHGILGIVQQWQNKNTGWKKKHKKTRRLFEKKTPEQSDKIEWKTCSIYNIHYNRNATTREGFNAAGVIIERIFSCISVFPTSIRIYAHLLMYYVCIMGGMGVLLSIQSPFYLLVIWKRCMGSMCYRINVYFGVFSFCVVNRGKTEGADSLETNEQEYH